MASQYQGCSRPCFSGAGRLHGLDHIIPNWFIFLAKMFLGYAILIGTRGTLLRLNDGCSCSGGSSCLRSGLANCLGGLEVVVWQESGLSAGILFPIFAAHKKTGCSQRFLWSATAAFTAASSLVRSPCALFTTSASSSRQLFAPGAFRSAPLEGAHAGDSVTGIGVFVAFIIFEALAVGSALYIRCRPQPGPCCPRAHRQLRRRSGAVRHAVRRLRRRCAGARLRRSDRSSFDLRDYADTQVEQGKRQFRDVLARHPACAPAVRSYRYCRACHSLAG